MTENPIENNKYTSSVTNLPAEQFTDSQLSDVFARDYNIKARYCHEAGYWFVWNGIQWAPDICGEIITLVEESVKKQIMLYAETAESAELKRIISCLSTGRFRSIVDLAKSKMPIKKAQFNADPWLLNCNNGVVNLRTGELMSHNPDLYQCFKADVSFDKDKDCPLFKSFVRQIMLDTGIQ